MSDVMTKEEREFFNAQRYKRGQGIWSQLVLRLASEVERLRARNERLEAVAKAASLGAESVRELMSNSRGVDGYHRNGDIAEWEEIEAGGRLECIAEFNALEAALSALKEEGK